MHYNNPPTSRKGSLISPQDMVWGLLIISIIKSLSRGALLNWNEKRNWLSVLTLRWGWCPIQTCKSTAHGDDGVTYDIVQLLAKVQLKGRNHLTWPIRQGSLKRATIILIPEPGRLDEYTPISLTSCLSKTCEKKFPYSFAPPNQRLDPSICPWYKIFFYQPYILIMQWQWRSSSGMYLMLMLAC